MKFQNKYEPSKYSIILKKNLKKVNNLQTVINNEKEY